MGKLNRRKFCACGVCGLVVKPDRRFVRGHNNKGTHFTEEHKQNLSKPQSEESRRNMKEAQNRPEVKLAKSEKSKQRWANPEEKIKQSKAQKEAWSRPGAKEKRSITLKEAGARPEVKEKKSISLKIANAKPEVKEKRRKSALIVGSKIETKEGRSKRGKQKWEQPEYRKNVTDSLNKEEVRINASEKSIKNWQNSEYVEKQRIARDLKPNKTESYIIYLLNVLFPGEWRYTGDFSFWINHKNPDFVNCNGQKKCIEFNGDYYHQNDIPGEREKIFAEFGYDTLMLSDKDLIDEKQLRVKLTEFHLRENLYSKHGEL